MFGNFGSDIDYTLHAYPNHPRALVTLVRLGEREKTEKPKGSAYTIDCYFRRAIRFASSDLVVRMLYAQYLNKNGKRDAAVLQLNYVEASAADNAMTRYNLGLLLFEVEAFDRALAQAHQAMSLGLNPAELKRLLTEKGLWRDPPEPGVAASGAASAVTAK
jgi:tetratricopeptide (TPR) repeat protein